jgi:hypothetical protein
MTQYNIIIYIVEDDRNMSSSFFHDLVGLLDSSNKIPINIMYHSYNFFGDYTVKIIGDMMTFLKVEKVEINSEVLRRDLYSFYKKHYIAGKKNILVYGGHEVHIYINGFRNINSRFFEGVVGLELIVIDSCYSSTVSILSHVMDKTRYVIGCESASPNRGFVGDDFLKILNSEGDSVDKYKKIVDSFIGRNSSMNSSRYRKLDYRTDGVLINMDKYRWVESQLSRVEFKRSKRARLEDIREYNYYDVITMLESNQKELKRKVRECVLYHKKNGLCKDFLRRKGKRLTGISIGLK